jgi:hypothetical protein
MKLPFLSVMLARHRRARIQQLLSEVEQWEHKGRDMFAALVELTEPEDPLGEECRRVWELLEG